MINNKLSFIKYIFKSFYFFLAIAVFISGLAVGLAIDRYDSIPFLKLKETSWAIGIYVGDSPYNLSSRNQKNPVLTASDVTDVRARFVADPFMTYQKDKWYMFFEVLNIGTEQGDIGLATSVDGFTWEYNEIVLDESFHLSYPYIFKWNENYYMIPETSRTKSIRLYKATHFPTQWTFIKTLMQGETFTDPSIFQYSSKWWLFADTSPDEQFDTLRLYYSEDLMGAWTEHPASPVIKGNPNIARPAGRVIEYNDHIIRFAQDDKPVYGRYVRAFEITKLTPLIYEEKAVHENPILAPSGSGWNALRMHHIDLHQISPADWIACVDGRGEKRVFKLR
jgi:hypothetical protein